MKLLKSYNLKSISKKNFIPQSNKETIETKIYNLRNNEKLVLLMKMIFL